jgi:hypothetical protein
MPRGAIVIFVTSLVIMQYQISDFSIFYEKPKFRQNYIFN